MLTRVEAAGAAAPLQAVRARGVQQLRGKQGGSALQVQSVELMLTLVQFIMFITCPRPDKQLRVCLSCFTVLKEIKSINI